MSTNLMASLGVWVVALALLAATIQILFRHKRPVVDAYVLQKPLSEAEQTLYWRLTEALPECVILSQVTFSRFLRPRPQHASTSWALLNRISQKSADFVVCLKDFTVVAVVELDDRSHSPAKDAQRDAMLKSAGIPIVRLKVRDIPSVDALRACFTQPSDSDDKP